MVVVVTTMRLLPNDSHEFAMIRFIVFCCSLVLPLIIGFMTLALCLIIEHRQPN